MTEEIEANGEFQSQDSRGIENASDKNEANTDDEASGGIRKWWKRRNKEQRGSKNKERIPTKKSKMKDAIEKLLSTEEEREVLIGEKNYCINKLSEKTERILKEKRDSEKRNLANQEQLLETIELLKMELEKKDQMLTRQADLMNNKLEQERKTVKQLQKELEQEREGNSPMRKVQSDLVRWAMDEETVLRNTRDQQLREKETNFHGLQKTLGDEQKARLRLKQKRTQVESNRNFYSKNASSSQV